MSTLPVMHTVQSSNVASIGHDGTNLFVTFKSGGTWRYQSVPVATFDAMRAAKSVGALFYEKIRGKYTSSKVEEK